MRYPRFVARFVSLFAIALACMFPLGALANDHGGGGAPEPMVFTLNLGKESYVQFGLVFEAAKPEAMASLNAFKPRLQHRIILLMAEKDVDTLRTLAGKKKLIEEIVEIANEVIDADEETGIHEVLFSRFLIQ